MNHGENNIQLLAQIKRLTGVTLRMVPLETIDQIKTSTDGNQIGVLITTYQVEERRSDVRVVARGKRLVSLTRVNTGWTQSQMTAWESNFTPFFINHYGPGKTVLEAVAQRRYERLAGRPGTERAPLDSYTRVLGGYTTPRMQRHW